LCAEDFSTGELKPPPLQKIKDAWGFEEYQACG
jgi:hypothetical protein